MQAFSLYRVHLVHYSAGCRVRRLNWVLILLFCFSQWCQPVSSVVKLQSKCLDICAAICTSEPRLLQTKYQFVLFLESAAEFGGFSSIRCQTAVCLWNNFTYKVVAVFYWECSEGVGLGTRISRLGLGVISVWTQDFFILCMLVLCETALLYCYSLSVHTILEILEDILFIFLPDLLCDATKNGLRTRFWAFYSSISPWVFLSCINLKCPIGLEIFWTFVP